MEGGDADVRAGAGSAQGELMTANLVQRLALPGPPKSSFRSAPHLVELFYKGWSVEADATAGRRRWKGPAAASGSGR